ncbi:MAG: riboflavin kinase, partial [Candidatus Saccharimonadales bacterium]|nr:riboflavin kinase [Candidatus Saccharimonadales bacterium]
MNGRHNFKLKGIVKPYSGNGRRLGYPTANIQVPNETAEGLFLGYAEIKGQRLPALIYIGAPVSLGDRQKRAEA